MILRLACSRQNSTRTIRQCWDYSRYLSRSSLTKQQWSQDDFEVGIGTYSVILPSEPYVYGVEHITPRRVPPNIVRPHYSSTGIPDDAEYYPKVEDDGKIVLGGEAERRLRAAARLAKKVREYAGNFVKVCHESACLLVYTVFFCWQGWHYNKQHRRADTQLHHLTFCLPVSSSISCLPSFVLY
jgi:methionyl aminopeptidase